MPAPVLQFKRGNAGVAGTVPALRPGEPAISLNNFDFFIGIDTSVANNKFFGSHRYWGREDGTNSLRLKLVDKDGTNYVAIKTPNTLAGIVTYTLPGVQGANSTVLTNDGNGNLSWASGSANPVFTGVATFTDTTDNTLSDPDTGAVQINGGLGVNKNVTVGESLSVSNESHFLGTATFYNDTLFTNTSDNNLGNYNTGAVQIEGGLGVQKNLTVGAGLSVGGQSYFIGTATFYGGQINLGDSDADNISVAGEFVSNLVPNATNTYDLGLVGKRWRDGYFSRNLDVTGNLTVDGNVTVGSGGTIILHGEDVYIKNKDLIIGYTTSLTNQDASTDDTANHAGVAIASTVGSPLVSFTASGINTLPDTYKQLMWFHAGTLGFGTDAFAFNYGVAIGTATMANGVRLAVGSGVTASDTAVSATNFYGELVGNASSANQVKTVTASDNNANYHITFVDANNGSATNESVYTDDGIYYNPGSNKLTTQHAEFTGNVLVSGITTLAGNVSLGDSGSDIITVVGVATFTTSDVYINNQLYVGSLQITGGAQIGQDVTTRNLSVSGISTLMGDIFANGNVSLGNTSGDIITVKGTATFEQPVVGTISTATRATLIDTTNTTNNSDYYVTFVDTLAGENSETLRVGLGLSVNPSNGDVKTTGKLSVGDPGALTSYIKAGGGSDAMYLYGNGDVSFQQKVIVGGLRSSSNSNNTLILNDLDATFARNLTVTGIATVGTALSSPTLETTTIKSSGGTTALTLSGANVTVAGDLFVSGNTTQVNTTAITVEDRTIELGRVDGNTPSSTTTWDLGVLFNYNSSGAKKSAVIWEHNDSRFKFASVLGADTDGTDANTPQLSVTTFAPIEIGALWVNDCAGQSQVISCTGTERFLENITIDAGQF